MISSDFLSPKVSDIANFRPNIMSYSKEKLDHVEKNCLNTRFVYYAREKKRMTKTLEAS